MRLPLILSAGCFFAAAASASDPPPPAAGPDPTNGAYDAAKLLFDTFAPDDVKAKYRFPSPEEAQDALRKLQTALDGGSLEDLAQYADQARDLLPVLRAIPGCEDYADWLAARLDEMQAAQALKARPGAPHPSHPPAPASIPYYGEWLARVRTRPPPASAAALMPRLQAAFRAEGVPPQIAWIAEAESSLNPTAQSPAGAKGLFQFTPATARDMGLSTFLPDERTNPDKSARAAARDLRALAAKFHSWPLAFAAYNAGEGRVSRLLAAHHATSFAAISAALPGETRMYVPKVCALIAVRTGTAVERLPL